MASTDRERQITAMANLLKQMRGMNEDTSDKEAADVAKSLIMAEAGAKIQANTMLLQSKINMQEKLSERGLLAYQSLVSADIQSGVFSSDALDRLEKYGEGGAGLGAGGLYGGAKMGDARQIRKDAQEYIELMEQNINDNSDTIAGIIAVAPSLGENNIIVQASKKQLENMKGKLDDMNEMLSISRQWGDEEETGVPARDRWWGTHAFLETEEEIQSNISSLSDKIDGLLDAMTTEDSTKSKDGKRNY